MDAIEKVQLIVHNAFLMVEGNVVAGNVVACNVCHVVDCGCCKVNAGYVDHLVAGYVDAIEKVQLIVHKAVLMVEGNVITGNVVACRVCLPCS